MIEPQNQITTQRVLKASKAKIQLLAAYLRLEQPDAIDRALAEALERYEIPTPQDTGQSQD